MKEALPTISAALAYDLEVAKEQVKNNKAVIIIVDGYLGVGKTTTGVTLGRYIQPSFNPEKQVGRGVGQFSEAWNYTESLRVGRGVKACVFDEAQDIDRASHASKKNKAIRMFFDTFRDARTVLILCLPHFSRLESSVFFTGAVRFLVHISEQHKNTVNGYVYEPERIDRMLDYLHRNRNDVVTSKKKVYMSIPYNYLFNVRRPESDRQRVIDRASSKGKRRLRAAALERASEED